MEITDLYIPYLEESPPAEIAVQLPDSPTYPRWMLPKPDKTIRSQTSKFDQVKAPGLERLSRGPLQDSWRKRLTDSGDTFLGGIEASEIFETKFTVSLGVEETGLRSDADLYIKTWHSFLKHNCYFYIEALRHAQAIGGMGMLSMTVPPLHNLRGRDILAAAIGRDRAERAERLFYQGFPGSTGQLKLPYWGYTEF